jgi:hypothetical protein
MDQRILNLPRTLGDKKNGVLGIFGDGIFKSGLRIEVIDSWGVESTQESKDSMEESRNHHQWS